MFGKKKEQTTEPPQVKARYTSYEGKNIMVIPVSDEPSKSWQTLDQLISEGYGVLFTVRYMAYGSSIILQKGVKTQVPVIDSGDITAQE